MRIEIQTVANDWIISDDFDWDQGFDKFMDHISGSNFLSVNLCTVQTAFNLKNVVQIREVPNYG